jgi:hypothetical protein
MSVQTKSHLSVMYSYRSVAVVVLGDANVLVFASGDIAGGDEEGEGVYLFQPKQSDHAL